MTDFASMHVWSDEDATSTNPICLEDIICLEDVEEDRFDDELAKKEEMKKKNDKKKRRRRRKKASGEDSSVADSMLSSILSESDDVSNNGGDKKVAKHTITTIEKIGLAPLTSFHEKRELEKQRRREKLETLKSRRLVPKKQVQPMRTSLYPSSDEESNDVNDDLSQNPFSDHKKNTVDDDDLSKNPFSDHKQTTVDDDDLSKNPFSDQKETTVSDDDLSKNPFSKNNAAAKNKRGSNPFADDSIRDRAISDSDESSTVRPPPLSTYLAESKTMKGTNPFANEEESFDNDDEDIIESSRRLLRCVDQRIQYQQQNDEVRSLKAQLKQMRVQAEAMAEQLRRAVETKCDLVLAQNEMERNHEQGQIAKDAESRDLRMYIQEILEQQAKSELNFMNEIASLARTLEASKKKQAREIENKDSKICTLENRIKTMRVSSVRGTHPESFQSRLRKEALFVNPSHE